MIYHNGKKTKRRGIALEWVLIKLISDETRGNYSSIVPLQHIHFLGSFQFKWNHQVDHSDSLNEGVRHTTSCCWTIPHESPLPTLILNWEHLCNTRTLSKTKHKLRGKSNYVMAIQSCCQTCNCPEQESTDKIGYLLVTVFSTYETGLC